MFKNLNLTFTLLLPNSEIISEFENLGDLSEKYYKFISDEIYPFNFSAK